MALACGISKRLTVHEHVAGVEAYAHGRHLSAEQHLLVIVGDVYYAVNVAFVEFALRLRHVVEFVGDDGVGTHADGLDELAAGVGLAHVHHPYRHVAQHLRTVRRGVDRGVYDRREHHDEYYARIAEYVGVLVAHDDIELPPVRFYGMCYFTHVLFTFFPSNCCRARFFAGGATPATGVSGTRPCSTGRVSSMPRARRATLGPLSCR